MDLRALSFRAVAFALVWIALAGTGWDDLAVGAVAVALALWASLGLLPPARRRFSLAGMLAFAADFLGASLLSGIDVARRALDPRLPLATGFRRCPSTLHGMERVTFRAIMSLQPGTLPVRDLGEEGIVLHCLDVTAPVEAAFSTSEARFKRLMRRTRDE